MINLSITNITDRKVDIFINNDNSMLVLNKKSMFSFIYYFTNLFQNKENDYKIFFGNKTIDSKTAIFFNLLDYTAIMEQFSFKKGSMIFEYLTNVISSELEEYPEDLAAELNAKYDIDTFINYTTNFEVDAIKLLNNFGNIKLDVDINNFENSIFKLLNFLVSNNPNKTFIIFQDKQLINANLSVGDNVYVFHIGSDSEPNIILGEEIINYEKQLVVSHLELVWPLEINKGTLKAFLNEYFTLLKRGIYETEDYNIYLISMCISQMYGINNFIKLKDNIDIPIEIQQFIKENS